MQKTITLSTRAYLIGIARGNPETIEQIHQNYFERISIYIKNNGGNIEDAKDVFQDAIMAIYVKCKSQGLKDLECSFYTFLYAICKNLWLKKCRKLYREADYITEMMESELSPKIVETIELKERWELYREKFGKLCKECQDIMEMHFEKKSFKEIGEITGLSSNYVKKKKCLCKKTLLNMISKDSRFKEI